MSQVTAQLALAQGEVRRLFHGRSGLYPGLEALVIDWFPPVAVIRLYQPLPAELVADLSQALESEPGVNALVLQERFVTGGPRDRVLSGTVPERLTVTENGLQYEVRLLGKQNAGLFLDMREGRSWVREHAAGKRILNLFAYTCGFSVAALSGGARAVVNLDMSSSALNTGRTNHRLNGQSLDQVKFMAHDLFRSWGKVKKFGPYDLVVMDPPSFQKGSFVASKDYQRVMQRLDGLTTDNAKVLACHNDPQHDCAFLQQLMLRHSPQFAFEQRLANPADFPEPNSEQGLKALVYAKSISDKGECRAWT
ncbi:class I SAM-dependent methyltransferase [Pontibacter sp. JAM-7]|uniref:class I SAM-dependent methyltransferase n=1 Tax=Pontibacter sp. JAM-7 TaxID=3366581 RepID=UPI003AF58FD5